MESDTGYQRLIGAGLLLGLGLGGFFDGIVLHQILQWHHMVSNTTKYPMTTLDGLKANTLGDGLFHAASLVLTVVGLFLLWGAGRRPTVPWSTKLLVSLLLMGWGAFNLVEGTVDHHILTLHHVRERTSHQGAWDIAFLAWGAGMLLGGWWLARAGEAASTVALRLEGGDGLQTVPPAVSAPRDHTRGAT